MSDTETTRPGDEMRADYDATVLTNGVRGKHYAAYRSGTNLALLDPDVRAAFPTDESVNAALRTVMRASSP